MTRPPDRVAGTVAVMLYLQRGQDVEWKSRAACKDLDPNLFFPERGVAGADVRRAKAVCRTCPVRSECWEAGRESLGIWGGETRNHRPHVARQDRASSYDQATTPHWLSVRVVHSAPRGRPAEESGLDAHPSSTQGR